MEMMDDNDCRPIISDIPRDNGTGEKEDKENEGRKDSHKDEGMKEGCNFYTV